MCEGPIGKCKYLGNGTFIYNKKELPHKNNLAFISGGTGITPHYSIALASIMAQDGLNIKLLFTNKSKSDIICQNELENLRKINPEKFELFYTLTRHNEETDGEWDGLVGRPNIEMV